MKRYKCEDCNQYWEVNFEKESTNDRIIYDDELLEDKLLLDIDEDSEVVQCPMCGSPYVIEV